MSGGVERVDCSYIQPTTPPTHPDTQQYGSLPTIIHHQTLTQHSVTPSPQTDYQNSSINHQAPRYYYTPTANQNRPESSGTTQQAPPFTTGY